MVTYRQLQAALAELTEEQLDMQVSNLHLADDGEFQLTNVQHLMLASEAETNFEVDLEEMDVESNVPLLVTKD